jgi:hypothetical protein
MFAVLQEVEQMMQQKRQMDAELRNLLGATSARDQFVQPQRYNRCDLKTDRHLTLQSLWYKIALCNRLQHRFIPSSNQNLTMCCLYLISGRARNSSPMIGEDVEEGVVEIVGLATDTTILVIGSFIVLTVLI